MSSITRSRAKRAEQITREIMRVSGAYAPVKRTICNIRRGNDDSTRDTRGVDYWPYSFGAAIPVEVKSKTVDYKTWESTRYPLLLTVRDFSEAQLLQLERDSGWVSFVLYVKYKSQKTQKAYMKGIWFAPFRVWEMLRQDKSGWRRTHLEQLSMLGYEVKRKNGVLTFTDGLREFGCEVTKRSLLAAMWNAYHVCEHADDTEDFSCTMLYSIRNAAINSGLVTKREIPEIEYLLREIGGAQ